MKKFLLILFTFFFSTFIFAQNVNTGGHEKLTIKGFISVTLFGQNQSFSLGNGQDAQWAKGPEYTQNRWFYGGDVRNSRITLVYNGPKISGSWKLGGVLEFDAFGGFNGAGAFSSEQPIPRLRLAYVDLVHKNLTLRIGQAWTPLFGNVPVSLSHIAFPLGHGNAGKVGWRFPGIYFYYKFNSNGSSTQFGLDAALFEGSWSGPGNNVNFLNAGNAGTPQFELRLNLSSKLSKTTSLKAYVVGHYDRKNLAGVNAPTSLDLTSTASEFPPPISHKSIELTSLDLTGTAFEFGASLKSGGFLIHGNIYSGKNIGQQLGELMQIQPVKVNKDLSSVGFWVQLGYNFTKHWGIYGFYGLENVNKNQAKAIFSNPRLSHNLLDFMLRYETGPIGFGIELLHSKLTYGLTENTVDGTQIAFSTLYKF